ncbi:MAG: DUF2087 domain-containing protein [Syntrophomonas sp.]
MSDALELFWNASLEEFKRGYIEEANGFTCLLCCKKLEKGIVYSEDGVLYEAERYMRVHIEKAHGSVFDYLINLDRKLTGLTDHQKCLMQLFYQGKSDSEVQEALGIGSASTIRNHRFVLKEKERQSKVFLAMMELLKEKDKYAPAFLSLHKNATMIDDRYNITEEERQKILRTYFTNGLDGPLKSLPGRQKQIVVILRELARRFDPEKVYSENEVNQILQDFYDDYASLRRYLIDYRFLDRNATGSKYWLK